MSTTGERGGSNTNIPTNKIVKGLDGSNTLSFSDVTIDSNNDMTSIRNLTTSRDIQTGPSGGSTYGLKTNKITSIGTNDDIIIDANGSGSILMNSLVNGGLRLVNIDSNNANWISALSYTS